jgi:SOS-response transcriptional repressor LexA
MAAHPAYRRPPRELGYRGRQVLAYVRTTVQQEGSAPSYAMIRDALGFCDEAGVSRVVEILEKRGLLRRVGAARVRRGVRRIRLVVNNK